MRLLVFFAALAFVQGLALYPEQASSTSAQQPLQPAPVQEAKVEEKSAQILVSGGGKKVGTDCFPEAPQAVVGQPTELQPAAPAIEPVAVAPAASLDNINLVEKSNANTAAAADCGSNSSDQAVAAKGGGKKATTDSASQDIALVQGGGKKIGTQDVASLEGGGKKASVETQLEGGGKKISDNQDMSVEGGGKKALADDLALVQGGGKKIAADTATVSLEGGGKKAPESDVFSSLLDAKKLNGSTNASCGKRYDVLVRNLTVDLGLIAGIATSVTNNIIGIGHMSERRSFLLIYYKLSGTN